MSIQHRQEKIKEKRKQTPFHDFARDIASWMPFALAKNNGLVSRYPTERMSNILSNKDFEGVRNNEPDIDLSSGNFFENLQKLFFSVPINATIQQGKNENSEYADSVLNSNNVYLTFGTFENCSNVVYSALVTNNCSNIFNAMQITNSCENIYYSKAIDKSSNVYYSKFIINSSNIRFSSNLTGCHNCIGCHDLQNVSYYINNQQKTKEEYKEYFDLMMQKKDLYTEKYNLVSNKSLNAGSKNVKGNGILFSSDIENGYYVTRANKGRNLVLITGENADSNLYDCCDTGINAVDFYGVQAGGTNANNYYCVSQCESCFNIYYSYYLHNCSYCFGCVGLKNKQYCIFNKQYTKEEREKKVDEICSQMDKDGTLGKFFPGSMNPFYFNDTAAYLIDPSFTKEEVTALGYLRRDEPIKVDIPASAEVVKTSELGQFESFDASGKRQISKDILKKIVLDEEGNYYRIVKMEYDFLMKHSLPLPRKHRIDRMKENFILH